jgi:anaerobic magnesium-protoporphyrin IX monomethyl ester cyclase
MDAPARTMKICLALKHSDSTFTPLPLMCLKAALLDLGHWNAADIPLVEFDPDTPVEDMVERILALAPDVLGLSCYVWNVASMLEAGRRVKLLRPALRVVLGGPEVGPQAEDVLAAHSWVDAIVKNEGEIPMTDLADRWRRGAAIDDVAGIVIAQGDRIVDTGPERFVRDLNQLPTAYRDFRSYSYKGKYACIETQRGCVFTCNFCFFNKDLPIRNRRFDPARVDREITYLLQLDLKQLYFMDPIFNLNAKRAKEICRLIIAQNERRIARGERPVASHAEMWAEFVDEELAALMKAANFNYVELGLQTTDTATLITIERRLRMEQFIAGVGHLKKAGLYTELHLIFGLPGDTLPKFRDSLNFAATLDPTDIGVFPLQVLPGTDLWTKSESFGLSFDREAPHLLTSTATLSPDDLAYGFRIIRAAPALWKSLAVRLLTREPGVHFSDIVEGWIGWIETCGGDVTDVTTLREYLDDFCGGRRIPAAFYLGMARAQAQSRPTVAS